MLYYDYEESETDDIVEAIKRNGLVDREMYRCGEYADRDRLEEELDDRLWTDDSVTGNCSGSYTGNVSTSREYVYANPELLADALYEFGNDAESYRKALLDPDYADVSIRCYLLRSCICKALDEVQGQVESGEYEPVFYDDEDMPTC